MADVIWTTDPSVALEPRLTDSEYGNREPTTVVAVMKDTVAKFGSDPAFSKEFPKESKTEDGDEVEMEWISTSWQEYYDQSCAFAKSLISIGFEPHRSVNIIGFNSPEWFVADLGAIFAGGLAAGIYTTNLADSCHYIAGFRPIDILNDSKYFNI